jgi:hypothetical protein
MLTGEIRSKVDALWNAFWSGGIANPIEVIEQITAIGSSTTQPNDWGVYEDKTFFWRTPGTYGRTWHVRRDQVATPTSDGPQADQRVAGIKVVYSDASGRERSVGPVGSNADTETNDLLSIDPDNPASQIPGAFEVVNVGLVPLVLEAVQKPLLKLGQPQLTYVKAVVVLPVDRLG